MLNSTETKKNKTKQNKTKHRSFPLCCPSNWVVEFYHQLLGQSWMTFIIFLFFQASSHGSCTFEKREADLQCRWKVSECAWGLFCVHSISWYFSWFQPFTTSCLTGEHWLCLIMRNNPRQNKILSDLREMIHQNQQKEMVNVTPAILASSSFDSSFQCCLMTDWHTKHWTCK